MFAMVRHSGNARKRRTRVQCRTPNAPREYVVADELFIGVVSRDQGACLSACYLGHEPGTVWLPPAVIHDCLLVCEQTGPHHTSIHVLRRGDQLQPIQILTLPGVVTGTPVLLGELAYLPTDHGHVRMLKHQPTDQERPYVDDGELNVANDLAQDDVELQLAAVQGKLWVGGRGVRIFEPAAVGTPAKRRPAIVGRPARDAAAASGR